MRHRFRPSCLVIIPVDFAIVLLTRFTSNFAIQISLFKFVSHVDNCMQGLMLYEPHTCIDHKQESSPFIQC